MSSSPVQDPQQPSRPQTFAALARPHLAGLRSELRPTLRLAWPVIAGEVGWMAMGLVDTLMVAPLGSAAIGAAGIGSNAFMAVAIFGMGLLLGLDTLVSRAFGARRMDECHRWLVHGIVLALLVSVPLTLGVWTLPALLARMGVHPDVLPLATDYLRILDLSLLPLLLYAAFRRYLQGTSLTRPVGVALVSANLINVAANWAFIYGNLGLPAMGVAGSAWATCVSRVYMAAVLALAIVQAERRVSSGLWHTPRQIDVARVWRLVTLGLPAALQLVLEVGVFAATTALAGLLVPTSLAAHHIAMNWAALVFMVPLGMSSAAAVRVGQALGRGDVRGAVNGGGAALGLVVLFMLVGSILFLSIPGVLIFPVHTRCDRRRRRGGPPPRGRAVPGLRWPAGYGDRRAPRSRRHAHAARLQLRRALVPRLADRVPALLSHDDWRHRLVDRAGHRPHARRRGPPRHLAPPRAAARVGHCA